MKYLIILATGFVVFASCKKDIEPVSENIATDIKATTETAKKTKFTFDTQKEGWSIYGDADIYHSETLGNPGGCIYAVDQGTGIYWYFTAPDELVNKIRSNHKYGGVLKFDLKAPTSNNTNQPDVVIQSDNLTLVYDASKEPSGTVWNTYTVIIKEDAAWHSGYLGGQPATQEEIKYVLRHLRTLYIRGEFFVGADTGYLDNVSYE